MTLPRTLRSIDTLRRETVGEQITTSLREAIRSGQLKDGEELNQVSLAELFGVSRVPVREALRQLEAEGWIKAPVNRRAYVHELAVEEVDQIFEVRLLLERRMLAKAFPKMTARDIAAGRAAVAKMSGLRDHAARLAANRAFHQILLAPAGAPWILDLIETLTGQVERYVRLHGVVAGHKRLTEAEHGAILDALEARDLPGARKLLVSHVEKTRTLVLAALRAARAAGDEQREGLQ